MNVKGPAGSEANVENIALEGSGSVLAGLVSATVGRCEIQTLERMAEWTLLQPGVCQDAGQVRVFGPHNPFRESLVIDFKNGLVLKILRLTCMARRTRAA